MNAIDTARANKVRLRQLAAYLADCKDSQKVAPMRPLEQSVRDAFLAKVRGREVGVGEVWDYVKWLRYYLDFCGKYRHEALDRESLQTFLHKLASKNQSAEQQDQAARSVSLYLELAAP